MDIGQLIEHCAFDQHDDALVSPAYRDRWDVIGDEVRGSLKTFRIAIPGRLSFDDMMARINSALEAERQRFYPPHHSLSLATAYELAYYFSDRHPSGGMRMLQPGQLMVAPGSRYSTRDGRVFLPVVLAYSKIWSEL